MKHIYALFALLITSFVSWGQTTTWVKLDNHTDVTAQGTYMIVDVNSSHALTSANGSNSAPSAVDVIITDNTISGEISENLQWTFEFVESGYIIRPLNNQSIALTSTNSNNGVRVNTGAANVWSLNETNDSGYKGFKNNSHNRYMGVYQNQDWRTYTSIHSNIENTQIEIFQLVEAPTGDHTITVTQADGGEITPGTTGVNNGESATFTATPASTCYVFSHWVVDGVDAGNTNPYTFTNVTADHEITAVFNATASYEISATAGANGTITPSGTINVNCGAAQTFTFTAEAGYAVADVLVNGVSVGALSTYTFEDVTEDQTIVVNFEEYTGPCVIEDFSGIANSSSYGTKTWTGFGGTWTASDAREDQTINEKAITIRNGVLTSPEFTGGIGSITMTTKLPFSADSAGNLTVKVNNIEVGTIPYSSTVTTSTINDINISGNVIVTIHSSGARVTIDDLEWTCYSEEEPIPTPTASFELEDLHIQHNINATTPTVVEAIVNIANLTEEFNLSVVSTTEDFVVNTTGELVNGENTIQIQLADGLAAGEYTGSIIVSLGEEILAALPLTGEVVDIPLSTPENAIEGLRIYPNPATDVVFVTSNSGAMKNVQLFDLSGKKVLDVDTTSSFQVNALANGIYVMKVTEEGKTSTSKLIVK